MDQGRLDVSGSGGEVGRGRPPRVAAARRRDVRNAYLLMAPALLLLAGVMGYPLAWQIWASLTDLSPLTGTSAAFVGLDNYVGFLRNAEFWRAAAATVAYMLVTGAAKLALGTGFALLLAKPFPGRPLVFLAIFLPWAYPGSVSIIGWYWSLNPPIPTAHAAFVGALKSGMDDVFGGGAWAFLSVVLFNIWRGASFTGVFLLAGINAIPPALFEYAHLECGSAWRRFWLVTVPMLGPFLALAVFLSLTTAFADLANVWMLTGGRIVFPVIGTQAYGLAVRVGQIGRGSALSLMLVPLLVAALIMLFRWFDPPETERV